MASERPSSPSAKYVSEEGEDLFAPGVLNKEKALAKARAAKFVTDEGTPFPLKSSIKDVQSLGIGVTLYLRHVKFLIFLFLGLAGLGSGLLKIYRDYDNSPINTANLATAPDSGLAFTRITINSVPAPSDNYNLVILELVMAIFFFVLLFFFKRAQSKIVDEVDKSIISTADFSVRISGLPTNEMINTAELAEIFGQFGEVAQVAVNYNFGTIARAMQLSKELTEKIEHEKLAIQLGKSCVSYPHKLEKQLLTVKEKLEKAAATQRSPTGHGFIVFQYEESKIKCLQAGARSFNPLVRLFQMCCSDPIKYHGRTLNVLKAPEPFSVQWPNLEFGLLSRLFRRIVSFIAALISIAACFGALVVLNVISKDMQGASATIIKVIVSVLINVLNKVILIVLDKLSSFERHHDFNAEESTSLIKIATAQFCSTGLVILFTENLLDRQGFFASATDTINILIITQFVTSCIISLLTGIIGWFGRIGSKGALTQYELEKRIQYPEFNLKERTIFLTKVTFLVLTYATAFPLLLWIAFIGFVATYYIDKYNLLRVMKRPRNYDQTLPHSAADMLPWAYGLHVVFMFFFYYLGQQEKLTSLSSIPPFIILGLTALFLLKGLLPDWASRLVFCFCDAFGELYRVCCLKAKVHPLQTEERFDSLADVELFDPPVLDGHDSLWLCPSLAGRRRESKWAASSGTVFTAAKDLEAPKTKDGQEGHNGSSQPSSPFFKHSSTPGSPESPESKYSPSSPSEELPEPEHKDDGSSIPGQIADAVAAAVVVAGEELMRVSSLSSGQP